jgi:hypothetical protein
MIPILFMSLLSLCLGFDNTRNQTKADEYGVPTQVYPLPLRVPTLEEEIENVILKRNDRNPWDVEVIRTYKHENTKGE